VRNLEVQELERLTFLKQYYRFYDTADNYGTDRQKGLNDNAEKKQVKDLNA
jgi:hypothetical protein